MTTIMGSGIDSLVLAIDVGWKDEAFFECLNEIKERAKLMEKDCPGLISYRGGREKWIFNVRPFGMRGYEWILSSAEFTMRVGNWMEPMTRPSIMVEISSSALWRMGPFEAYQRVLDIIEDNGGILREIKVSRADLCVDILLDEENWDDYKLREWRVCQARKIGLYLEGDVFETFTMGRGGEISARLYDKVREIEQKSHKFWMFDIWGIKDVPDTRRAIRIEFQIRREVMKELGVGKGQEFFMKIDEVWAYCTKKWLQFKDGPDKGHKERKTLPWWKKVQEGFLGVQGVKPAVREKAIKIDEKQLRAQLMGIASSLTALEMEKRKLDVLNFKGILQCMRRVINQQRLRGEPLKEFQRDVLRKRPKYSRPVLTTA